MASDCSSSDDEICHDFEARMATWQQEQSGGSSGVEIVFGDAGNQTTTSVSPQLGRQKRQAHAIQHQERVWSTIRERCTSSEGEVALLHAMQAVIRDAAAEIVPGAFDDFMEITAAPAIVACGSSGRLLIGNIDDASSQDVLASVGATAVVRCMESKPSKSILAMYETLGIASTTVPMADTSDQDLGPVVLQACPFLRHHLRSGGTVLIHCFIGANRSAAVAIAYLVLQERFELLEAVRAVARARGLILGSGSFPLKLVRLFPAAFSEIVDAPLSLACDELAQALLHFQSSTRGTG